MNVQLNSTYSYANHRPVTWNLSTHVQNKGMHVMTTSLFLNFLEGTMQTNLRALLYTSRQLL